MTKKKTRARGRPGRRTVLNDELIERIVERIRGVFYLKHCIESLGHSERVLHRWLQRGEEEVRRMEKAGGLNPRPRERIYVKLLREVRKAQSDLTQSLARVIVISGLGQKARYLEDKDGNYVRDSSGNLILQQGPISPNWKAAARFLEAVDHERWGRKIRQEITTPEGGPTELRVTIRKKREVREPKEL